MDTAAGACVWAAALSLGAGEASQMTAQGEGAGPRSRATNQDNAVGVPRVGTTRKAGCHHLCLHEVFIAAVTQ